MRYTLACAMMTTMAALSPAASLPLAAYTWKARVFVISAIAEHDAELGRQNALLNAFSQEMKDRDLVVVRVIGTKARDDRGATLDATAVRRAASLASDRFGVALIGKDGGVKLSRAHALTARELFDTIDAMPMRQNEMRRKQP